MYLHHSAIYTMRNDFHTHSLYVIASKKYVITWNAYVNTAYVYIIAWMYTSAAFYWHNIILTSKHSGRNFSWLEISNNFVHKNMIIYLTFKNTWNTISLLKWSSFLPSRWRTYGRKIARYNTQMTNATYTSFRSTLYIGAFRGNVDMTF